MTPTVSNLIILDVPGVRAAGEYKHGLAYSISDKDERGRLLKRRHFRELKAEEAKPFTEKDSEFEYPILVKQEGSEPKKVTVKVVAFKKPEQEPAAAPQPEAPAKAEQETSNAGETK